MLLADILKRWQLLNGKDAILCTGTDEHGMKVTSCKNTFDRSPVNKYRKVQQASARAGVNPMQFCDEVSENFKVFWRVEVDLIIALILIDSGQQSRCLQ
jgi:methionyl-tRNA synthetase